MKDLLEIATEVDGISAMLLILSAEIDGGGASRDVMRDALHSLSSYLETVSEEIGAFEDANKCRLRKEAAT